MKTEILIIGGGLAGLRLATQLADRGRDFLLVEARDRLGGRILSERLKGAEFDFGPAWFWPGQQRMIALVEKHGLHRFEQYARGELSFEDEQGRVHRGYGFASMQGSWRVDGGLGALIAAVARDVPDTNVYLSTQIVSLRKTDSGIESETATGQKIVSKRAVLALPPRIAANLTFTPAFPASATQTMKGIATWMAGQAKAVAVYNRPFWREAGLSGDAMSRRGPMVEIHDASPAAGGPYGLFGFIGVPPKSRLDQNSLRVHARDQLVRLFGPQAENPLALEIKDWAADPFSATELDHPPLHTHPSYRLPKDLRHLWEGGLVFAGTEVAHQFGGYLEGALEAADNALLMLEPQIA